MPVLEELARPPRAAGKRHLRQVLGGRRPSLASDICDTQGLRPMRTDPTGMPVINQVEEVDRLIVAFHAIPGMQHRIPYLRAVKAGQLSI
jgi:hypothetical protein